jgi:hypothetical protein
MENCCFLVFFFCRQKKKKHSPVHIDGTLLPDPVRTVHRLPVAHRVPIVLDHDDSVGPGQIEPKAANVRCATGRRGWEGF